MADATGDRALVAEWSAVAAAARDAAPLLSGPLGYAGQSGLTAFGADVFGAGSPPAD